MTNSMTEGSPLRLILKFSLPLLLGNLFQQTYNMVDAAIVGQTLGSGALAGVGASSSVQFLVLGFCIGTCAGFSIPIAQRFGAKDYEGMRSCIYHAGVLTAVMAAVLTAVTALLCPNILGLLQTPKDIYGNAYSYLLIIFLGIPFTLLYNLLSGILRAVGDSRTPFFFLALSAVMNIFLDLFCILVLHWGVAGAAIATVVSQAVSGLLCLWLIVRKFEILHLKKKNCVWDPTRASMLLFVGVPTGLQFSITAIGSMVMQSANNSLGTVYVSGFTAGMKIKQFAMCPFDAMATAVSTFAGQNYGARKADRIRAGVRDGIACVVLYGIAIGLVLIFFGRTMSMLFVSSGDTAVLDASGRYLRCLGYFYWVLGILNVCRMSIQGLGYSGRAIFSGVLEMVARCIVALCFVPVYGYGAICAADQTAWIAGAAYVTLTCAWVIRKITGEFSEKTAAPKGVTS